MLNERRSLCEKVKRGTDTAAGRAAIVEMMKKSSAPFALIGEPSATAQQFSAFAPKHKSVTNRKFDSPV